MITIYPLEMIVTYDPRPGYGKMWVGKVVSKDWWYNVDARYEYGDIEGLLHKQLYNLGFGPQARDRIVPELMRFMEDWTKTRY